MRTKQTSPGRLDGAASAGFSLIEVLIALLVLSIGLLGLAGLQANAVAFNHSAYMRTQATNLAYDISDRMRTNRQAALDGEYTHAAPNPAPACGSAVAGATVAARDISAWHIALSCVLPNGNGSVNLGAGGRLTVTVSWEEARFEEDGVAGTDVEQFVLVIGL
jgi:type IV pilus assembly protein PilV